MFATCCFAVVPLAGMLSDITEQLALYSANETVGGLITALLGNATEIILSSAALFRGGEYLRMVQLSLLGSIIANSLLVMGLSMVAGGWDYKQLQMNSTAASITTSTTR